MLMLATLHHSSQWKERWATVEAPQTAKRAHFLLLSLCLSPPPTPRPERPPQGHPANPLGHVQPGGDTDQHAGVSHVYLVGTAGRLRWSPGGRRVEGVERRGGSRAGVDRQVLEV